MTVRTKVLGDARQVRIAVTIISDRPSLTAPRVEGRGDYFRCFTSGPPWPWLR
jgi:hypothetical protein